MKIIAITGAKGFIGSNFIRKYKKKFRFIVFKENINNKNKLKAFIRKNKFDYFLHFAGLLRKNNNKKLLYKTNYLPVKNIISLLIKEKIIFFFPSSSHVYQSSNKKIREKGNISPINYYGKFKLKCENLIRKKLKNYIILRIFNIFGKKQKSGAFFKDIKDKIKKNEKIEIDLSIRDFIHVDEVCRIIYFLIIKNHKGIFNACSSVPLSLLDIVNYHEKKLKKKANIIIKNSKNIIVGNNHKIKSKGFKFLKKYNLK